MVFGDTGQYLKQVYQDYLDGIWNTVCECYDFEPMKMTQRNGIVRVVLVCPICAGKKSDGVKKSDYPNAENFQEYGECEWVAKTNALIKEVKDEALAKRNDSYQQKTNVFWKAYQQYLQSDKWKRKSAAVINRDGICQACLSAESKQAHHLTYKHVFNEPLFDLIGVCIPCHNKITKMDADRNGKLSSAIAEAYLAGELEL